MKIDAQRKVVRKIDEDKARQEGEKKGFDIDMIVELTGLEQDETEELQK